MSENRIDALREIHARETSPRGERAAAMEALRAMGAEPDACPFSGIKIPWLVGDIVCPGCGESGDDVDPDYEEGCRRCAGGFGVVDELYACEVPFMDQLEKTS